MTAPTVSVVLNCYNHEAYVAEAIESVLAQTFADFELIVIDNGSTDGSRKIIQEFDDPRIRLLLNDDNQSISKRLNQGVAAARGEYVSILYSDDYFLPDKLARQVAIFSMLDPDYGVVYCPALALNQRTGQQWQHPSFGLSGQILAEMMERHFHGPIDMSSPLVRRECYLRYPFIEEVFAEGEAILFRIAMRYRFHFDPVPLMVLRDHGGNMGKAVRQNHEMMMVSLETLEHHPDFPAACRDRLRDFRAEIFRNHAWLLLRMGDGDSGWLRERLRASIRLQPAQLLHPRMWASLTLASLPLGWRNVVNRTANRLRPKPENRDLVESYR